MPFFTVFRGLAVGMLLAPVLMVLTAWLQWDGASALVWQGLLDTVLPDYTATSLLLCALVAIGVVSIGSVSAAAVTLFAFPGRQALSWLLLLPLAMPAYVVAYAYTDFLQYSGPLQNWLRLQTGWQGALWPDIRSTWGAAVVLSLSLYPYVYLLCRSALSERAPQLMEAARLLGAGLLRRIFRVALPLARPAIAAGLALAMMETLADFGVSSYFGVQTFSTGIYKAWLVMDNRVAAAQLSSVLLLIVAAVLWWEHRAQDRLRFANRRGPARSNESQPLRLHGWSAALAYVLCLLPVLLGFVFPLLIMGHALWLGSQQQALPWAAFMGWFWNSLRLGGISALLAAGLDSIAHQVADVVDAMDQSVPGIQKIYLDGGPSRNPRLLDTLAAFIARPVVQCADPELSALGVAHMAGLQAGIWDRAALKALKRAQVDVMAKSPADWVTESRSKWSLAVRRARLCD